MTVIARAAALLIAFAAILPAAHAEDRAAILLPGSINDQSWNALGYSIVLSLRPHGFTTSYSENVADAEEAESMRDYAARGYTIVIGHSGRFLSAADQVGPEFPKVQFIVSGGNQGQAPNVMSIDFDNAQFGCQLGLLAARMSKTGKLGGVFGLEGVPNIVAMAGGFRICAKHANPAATVAIVYIKDMEDAASAKEAALSLIAGGADVLTGKLNAAQSGLVQAGAERNVFVTARSFDHTAMAPKIVLTNVIEDWPSMYGATADQVLAGKRFGSFVKYGYDTGPVTGAKLAYSSGAAFNPAVPPSVVAEVNALAAQFASGAMTIAPTREDARGGQ